MIPVLSPEEMSGVDRRATEPVEVLVGRAGAAVAKRAARLLQGAYGKHIKIVAGKGNNGADGRTAARFLGERGARVVVLEASDLPPGCDLGPCDLVIDAAYGTGLQRAYHPPRARSRVLAVDIPSGVNGTTGLVPEGGGALQAVATVTFASLKPGLLLGAGPELAGEVEVADIGLGDLVGEVARCSLVEDADVRAAFASRPREAHKWQSAVQVVAGSPGMTGAPWLVSRAALRSGAGYVRLSMPGVNPSVLPPSELVHLPVPEAGWHDKVLEEISRVKALVVGPGLGPLASGEASTGASLPGGEVGLLLASAQVPAVVDADGLNAIGNLDALGEIVSRREEPTVVTPHEGELTRLAGRAPGPDRVAAVRSAAAKSGAIVLLKGSTTVVASPSGDVLLSATGGPRLATAGTGDVLSGVIAGLMARGVPPFLAAALGAHVHGRAAQRGFSEGLVASDLPDLVAGWLSELRAQ
ncbi:MAG TPA: NAD(P)H-hydrate dehydratase [Acidimicrobiales bacterium]|nr:NAD(P)H-hydrate dehydratase [Acidimicrobiales bacterium]